MRPFLLGERWIINHQDPWRETLLKLLRPAISWCFRWHWGGSSYIPMIEDSMRNFNGETEHLHQKIWELAGGWRWKGVSSLKLSWRMRVRIDFLLIEVCVFQIRCVYQGMILLWVLGCQSWPWSGNTWKYLFLSLSLSIRLSIYLSIDRSIYRSIYLSIDLSICLSIHPSIYLFIQIHLNFPRGRNFSPLQKKNKRSPGGWNLTTPRFF